MRFNTKDKTVPTHPVEDANALNMISKRYVSVYSRWNVSATPKALHYFLTKTLIVVVILNITYIDSIRFDYIRTSSMFVIVCAVLVVVLCINAFVYQRSHYLRLEHDKMREVRKVAKLVNASRAVLQKNEKTKIEPQKNTIHLG